MLWVIILRGLGRFFENDPEGTGSFLRLAEATDSTPTVALLSPVFPDEEYVSSAVSLSDVEGTVTVVTDPDGTQVESEIVVVGYR